MSGTSPNARPEERRGTAPAYYGVGFYYLYGFSSLLLIFLLMPRARAWAIEGGYRWAYVTALSTLFAFVATPLFRYVAIRAGALDRPGGRKAHAASTPLFGGLAVYFAFAATLLANHFYSEELKGVALGATIVLLVGALDDVRGLPARIKILAQLAASLVVIGMGVRLSFLPPGPVGDALEVVLTVVWLIGITNALNFLDGVDGLAAGLGAISSFFIGLTAIQTDQRFLMFLSLALMGGCLGFLPYNFRPRRPAAVFLGDAGSTFIGFTLASLGVMGNWDNTDPIKAFSMPLLILGVLVFDTTFITLHRFATGRVKNVREWLEYVGRDHIHHRLLNLGMSPPQAVFFIYLIAASLGLSAVVLKNGRTIDAFLLIVQAFNIFFLVAILMLKGAEGNRREGGEDPD